MPGGVHPPLSVILSWPKPNYDNPQSEGNGIVVVSILLASICTTLVSLRLYTRICLIRQPGLDDFLVVLGLMFAILLTALILVAYYHHGIGSHVWDVRPTQFANARFVTWLSEYCVVLSVSFTKISILLFYRRLASGSYTKSFLWAVRIGILYNVAYCLGFVLSISFMCSPPDAYVSDLLGVSVCCLWKQFDADFASKWHCWNEGISLPVSGALSIIGDLYATILPALLLRRLQMPKKQKILLYGLFATGFLVVGAGIVRTIYMDRVINRSYDTFWILWTMWIWTLVEAYLAIMCACGPALKPLYVKYMVPKVISIYDFARSRQPQYGPGTPNKSAGLSYASKKGFAQFSMKSHQSRQSMNHTTTIGLGEDFAKANEMGIVVRSDIEQVEERASDESIEHATALAIDGLGGR